MNHQISLLLALCILVGCHSPGTEVRKELLFLPKPIDGSVDTLNDQLILRSPHTLQSPDRFVWGASVIKGDDGKYHMFYSSWDAGTDMPPFSESWVLHSEIGYAVSEYPDKYFEHQKIILKGRMHEGDSLAWDAQMVHNPHIRKFNGKYYLYYIGSYDPINRPEYAVTGVVNKRNRVQQMQTIGVIEFNTFEEIRNGTFYRPDEPLLRPRTRVKADNIVDPSPPGTIALPDNIVVVNPSVVYRPQDKKYLLYFKGNLYDPNWRGVHGLALSDSPAGPFTPLDEFVFEIKTKDQKIANAEDPYVWYHEESQLFYAIIKDFSGRITGAEQGLGVLNSEDGIRWKQPEKNFFLKKEVILKNGDTLKVNNLERPQLLFDEQDFPQVLFAACSIGPVGRKTDGSTFNLHIPLESSLRTK